MEVAGVYIMPLRPLHGTALSYAAFEDFFRKRVKSIAWSLAGKVYKHEPRREKKAIGTACG